MSNGGLTRNELEDLRHMFQLFDTKSTGTVSLLELKAVLAHVAKESDRPALNKVLSLPAFQTDHDRSISQEEFIELLTVEKQSGAAEARRVFELFDKENKEYIDILDLRRIAADLGEAMGDDELEEMIQRASSRDGQVTLDDFEQVLNQKL